MSYTAVLAGDDLKRYMNEQAEGLGTNVWWRIEKRMEPLFWWALGACVLGAIIATETYLHLPQLIHFAGYTAMAVGTVWVLADFVVVTFAKQPGTWKRYTVTEFEAAHPARTTWVSSKISAVRSTNPMAEFSVDVLERKDLPGANGIILYQWRGGDLTGEKEGPVCYPILLLNQRGNTIENKFSAKPFIA